MAERAELLERYRRGAELIATVMTGAAGSELDFRTAPEKWSVREIVAHLADSELVCGDRVRRLIAENDPTLMAFDQDAWARNLNYGKRKTSEAVESFRRLRAETFELVKDLPEEAFERAGTHSERGRETLRETLERMAKHAEDHARQIRAVRDQYKQAKSAKA
jgi:hypothetical protein